MFRQITGATIEEFMRTPLWVIEDFITIYDLEQKILKQKQDQANAQSTKPSR